MSFDRALPPQCGGQPPFADAREAKEWLKLLPLINTQQSSQELREALAQLNEARFDPLELLKTLELLREAVHTTGEGLQSHFLGKSLPLNETENARWQEAQTLWTQLETAYLRCWLAARDANAPLAEHQALIAERTLRYTLLLARGQLLIYRPVPASVWQRLFDYYRCAEAAGLAQTTVRDSLIELHGSSMPQAMLIHALLLAAGNPRTLTGKQLLWLDKRLEILAVRTSLAPQAAALPGKTCLQIDLDLPAPALRASRPLTGPAVREIDTLALAQVLTKRIKLLREGELPQKLGLGTELGPQAAESLLTELYRRWCELPSERPLPGGRTGQAQPCALGIANIQHFCGGNTLQPPADSQPQLDQRELQAIQLFGHTGRTPAHAPAAQTELWLCQHETALERSLTRPRHSSSRLALQQLVGLQANGQPPQLGVIRWLEESEDCLEIGLRLLPGLPQPLLGRALDLARFGQDRFAEVLLLPALPQLKSQTSLILPGGWHRQGRLLELWDGQTLQRVRLLQTLERGHDYERVLFTQAGT